MKYGITVMEAFTIVNGTPLNPLHGRLEMHTKFYHPRCGIPIIDERKGPDIHDIKTITDVDIRPNPYGTEPGPNGSGLVADVLFGNQGKEVAKVERRDDELCVILRSEGTLMRHTS